MLVFPSAASSDGDAEPRVLSSVRVRSRLLIEGTCRRLLLAGDLPVACDDRTYRTTAREGDRIAFLSTGGGGGFLSDLGGVLFDTCISMY